MKIRNVVLACALACALVSCQDRCPDPPISLHRISHEIEKELEIFFYDGVLMNESQKGALFKLKKGYYNIDLGSTKVDTTCFDFQTCYEAVVQCFEIGRAAKLGKASYSELSVTSETNQSK